MNEIFNLLNYIVLSVLIILVVVVGIQKYKSKKESAIKMNTVSKDTKIKGNFEVNYVQDFLDFEKIYRDMIIRDKSTKFTSVVHCSGINYDLMSENEKVMVEEAFIEFLNFIPFPIQIYVQTRKVDLKDSLKNYSSKIEIIESEMRTLVDKYNNKKADGTGTAEELGMLAYEIQRKHNLYEYAIDLNKHIETMSINNNVLQHKYYVVITYHIEELGLMTNFTEDEVLDMAYTELQTRCHSIIAALMGCDIEGKILDSNGLAELLYMAFNRDDAELFRLKDNMEAGFYRLYSTMKDIPMTQQNALEYSEDDTEEQLMLLTEGFDFSELAREILPDTQGDKVS